MTLQVTICRTYIVEGVCPDFLTVEMLRQARPWLRDCWKCGLPISDWDGEKVGLVLVEDGQQDRIVCQTCAQDLIRQGAQNVAAPKGVTT